MRNEKQDPRLELIATVFEQSKTEYVTLQANGRLDKQLNTEQQFALILVQNLLRYCPIMTMLELFDQDDTAGAKIADAIQAREYMTLEQQFRNIPDEYAFYLILKRYIDLYLALQTLDPTMIKLFELRAVLEDKAAYKYFHPRTTL